MSDTHSFAVTTLSSVLGAGTGTPGTAGGLQALADAIAASRTEKSFYVHLWTGATARSDMPEFLSQLPRNLTTYRYSGSPRGERDVHRDFEIDILRRR